MSLAEKGTLSESTNHSILDEEKGRTKTPSIDHVGVAEQHSQDPIVDEEDDSAGYAKGRNLYLIVLGLCISTLLVGLDNAILATAVPTITTAFSSLDDVGWYGSGFLITCCTLQPLAGKIFKYFSLKWGFLTFLAIFEIGSLLCATATSSAMLIIGRAVAGAGAAGMFSGALAIISNSIALRERPLYTGIITSMFGISSIAGPILGGVFTEHKNLTWRWCFYINLPLGAPVVAVLVLFFHPKSMPGSGTDLPLAQKLKHLDLPGLALFIPGVLMLLLAVQWGGNRFAWKSATIIGLFIGFGIMMIIFGFWQWHEQEEASIPPRIIGNRTIIFAATTSFLGLGAMNVLTYYVPIWFQVIKDESPLKSGIRLLPMVLGSLVMSIISGGLVTKYGHYNPWLFLGASFMAISGGMLSTFKLSTGNSMINGILVLGGFGSALLAQMPLIAIMSSLPQKDITTGTTVSVFFQFLGGAIFLAIGESIFVQQLVDRIIAQAPTVNPQLVIMAGAQGVRKVVTAVDLPEVLVAYNGAVVTVFYATAAGGILAFFSSLGIEWKSVKREEEK